MNLKTMVSVTKKLFIPLLLSGMMWAGAEAKAGDIINIYSPQQNCTYTVAGSTIDVIFRLYGHFVLTNMTGSVESERPTLTMAVNGDQAVATFASINASNASGDWKTDVKFQYTVMPGDMAAPLRIYGYNDGTGGAPYDFWMNNWEFRNVDTGGDAVWTANMLEAETTLCDEETLNLGAQNITIRTLSFDGANASTLAASGNTTWYIDTSDGVSNSIAIHIFTPSNGVIELNESGNGKIDDTLSMAKGETQTSFTIYGLAVGKANIYAMRNQDYNNYVSGSTANLTNYIVRTVSVTTPPAPTVHVQVADNRVGTFSDSVTLSETKSYNTGLIKVVLSEAFTNDVYVQIDALLSGAAQSNLTFNATPCVIPVHSGDTESSEYGFNVPDGTASSAGIGITLTPTVTNTLASGYYTRLEPTTIYIINVAPTLGTNDNAGVVAERGVPVELKWTADDVDIDRNAGMTVSWSFGDGTSSNLTGAAAEGSVYHTYTKSGTWTTTVTATDKDGGISSCISFPVDVKMPSRLLWLDVSSCLFDETSVPDVGYFTVRLSEACADDVIVRIDAFPVGQGSLTFDNVDSAPLYVTVPAGSMTSGEQRFSVPDGNAVSEKEGVVIIPTITNAPASFYTNVMSETLYVRNVKPVLTLPQATDTVISTCNLPYTYQWAASDVTADLVSGMTATWDFGDGTITNVSGSDGTVEHSYDSLGVKTVKVSVTDKDGANSDEICFLVYNSPVVIATNALIHMGALKSNEVWSDDVVHVVADTVIVPSGVMLTIETGAIVKFYDGTGIQVLAGGTLIARGARFTTIADDALGGDTNMDGSGSKPTPDAYTISGAGTLTMDSSTELRYTTQKTSGTISGSMMWQPGCTYCVTGDITVASGGILTIPAGTTLKFSAGRSLIVGSGGILNALGTRAQPIIFTSYKDDTYGGDTNGDGENSAPSPGDWGMVKFDGGIGDFTYCTFQYGGGVDGNQYSARANVFFWGDKGQGTFKGCTFARSPMDGCYAQNSMFENCLFLDNDRGLCAHHGNITAINCVFAYNRIGFITHYCPLLTVVNSIAAFNTGSGACHDNGSQTIQLCCFWNPEATDGNLDGIEADKSIEENPLFVDPEEWDFRIQSGSPCIDAGDGTAAPDTDYYGQPRMDVRSVADTGVLTTNNVCPDIGIYEYSGVYSGHAPDLQVTSVSIPDSARSGGTLQVAYAVANTGVTDASGSWRDSVWLVGETDLGGQLVKLGDPVATASLEAGATNTFTATFAIPAVRAGNWRVRVQANAYRDLFEQDTANNAADSETDVAIAVPELVGGTSPLSMEGLDSAGYEVTGLSSDGGSVLVTADKDVALYGAYGFMPSSDNFSWQGVDLGDGRQLLVYPANTVGQKAYLLIVNGATSAATAQATVAQQALSPLKISPTEATTGGVCDVTLTGTGFGTDFSAVLQRGDAQITLTQLRQLSPALFAGTASLAGAATGLYDVVVSSGGQTATLAASFEAVKAKTGPVLSASLEMPGSVRDGRLYTGWIVYTNAGDGDMRMPLFTVKNSTKTGLSDSSDGPFTNAAVYLGGLGNAYPAGVLKAGGSGRMPFYLLVSGSYKLTLSHCMENSDASPYDEFTNRLDYIQAMSDAATRFALRGRTEARITKLAEYELARRAGYPVAALSGVLRNARTFEPMAGVTVQATATNATDLTAVTDAAGYFQVDRLADGTYHFLLDGAALESSNSVVVAGQEDVSGIVLEASPLVGIAGKVCAADTGDGLTNLPVRLLRESGGLCGETATDGNGRYVFSGLLAGTYHVVADSYGGYVGSAATNLELTVCETYRTVNFELARGGMVTGAVTCCGAPVSNGMVRAVLANGSAMEVACATNGAYAFEGLPAATYAIRYVANEWMSDETNLAVAVGDVLPLPLEAVARPLFIAERTVGFGSLTTRFRFVDTEKAASVRSWAWDFDSDGTADSTEASPSNTFTKVGSYTVTLTVVDGDGNTTVSTCPDCVTVMEPIDNVLNANAFIVADNPDIVCESVTDTGLVLEGEPPITIAVGTVIQVETNGVQLIRKVTAVSQTGTEWNLTTEEAGLDDLYESYAFTTFGPVETSAESEGASNAQGLVRTMAVTKAASEKKVVFEGGVTASVELSPALYLDTACWKSKGGISYMRFAVVGEIGLSGSISFSGSVGGKISRTWSTPINILKIPTTVPGLTIEPDFEYGIEGTLKGESTGKVDGSLTGTLMMGCECRGSEMSWFPPFTLERSGNADLDLGVNGGVAISFRPKIKAREFGLLSVSLGPEFNAAFEFDSSVKSPATCDLKLGAALCGEANLIDIESPRFDYKVGLSGKIGASYSAIKWTSPEPTFDCQPASGEKPLTVHFQNQSTGDIVRYFNVQTTYPARGYDWGLCVSRSMAASPTATYYADGAYPVTLKAKGNFISSFMVAKDWVTVGDAKIPPDPQGNDDSDGKKPVKSCDPNEMAGPLGFGDADTQRYVVPGQWMDYIVYFENVSNATAAAQEVYVDENLSPYLDWSTLELGEVCFNNQAEMGLAGKQGGTFRVDQQGTSYQVRVSFSLDQATGAASWYLRSYDPTTADGWPADSFAGFLPPNDATHRGEGHVSYRVKVRADAPNGATISASASIVFDQNSAIMTNPSWWNTIARIVTVSFDAQGGAVEPVSIAATNGLAYGTLPEPVRTNYVFSGWWTGTDGTGMEITNGTPVTVTEDQTLYAKWISAILFQPADTDQDMTVGTLELLDYIDGWQQNLLDYQTLYLLNAVELWQSNKPYVYDGAEQPPGCWKAGQ